MLRHPRLTLPLGSVGYPCSAFTPVFYRPFTAGPAGTPPEVPHSPKPSVSLPFHAAWFQQWCRELTVDVFTACSDR